MRAAFELVLGCCLVFAVLTNVAMLIYPGGVAVDRQAPAYHFFLNFFSDLGRTRAINGQSNRFGQALFSSGVGAAGLGMITFFLTFPLQMSRTWNRFFFGVPGSVLGVAAGIYFVGVGLAPADSMGSIHVACVNWAFRCFTLAALFMGLATSFDRQIARWRAAIFFGFGIILAGYVALMTIGPSPATSSGLVIQVTGQKLIVYLSLVTIFWQAWLSRGSERRHLRL